MERKIIEITAHPYSQTAQSFLPKVVQGVGIGIRKPAEVQGDNCVWDYSDISDKDWNNAVPIIAGRLKTLYDVGAVRYVSWTNPF